MLELVKAGGWPMIPLLLLGVLALAIVVERFWSLRRKEILPPGLGEEVRALVMAWLDALAVQGKDFLGAHVHGLAGVTPVYVVP